MIVDHIPTREEIIARKARLGMPIAPARNVVTMTPRPVAPMAQKQDKMTPRQMAAEARAFAEKIKNEAIRSAALADLARREASRMVGCNIVDPEVRAAIERTLKVHAVTWRDVESLRRQKELIHARQHIAWVLRDVGGHSLPTIGRLIGGRDHTTILHAIRRFEARTTGAALVEGEGGQ